ncbi:MAG: DUF4249 domain-containing protein [Bacteroidota bacterium]
MALGTIVGLLNRCEEPVDLELDIPDPQIVLLSNFFPDELVKVQLSRTQSILSSEDYMPIEGATVRLLVGDESVEQLQEVEASDGNPPFYTTTVFKPRVGVRYTLHASAPGYDPISAVSSIPEPVPISLFRQTSLQVIDLADGETEVKLGFELDYEDPDAAITYYHLRLIQEVEELHVIPTIGDTVVVGQRLEPIIFPASSTNGIWIPALSRSGGGILLIDKPFSPLLNLNLTNSFKDLERPGRLFAELRVVSEDYYNFQSSLSKKRLTSGLPSNGQGGEIQNNVTNGQGVFAGYNSVLDTLDVAF